MDEFKDLLTGVKGSYDDFVTAVMQLAGKDDDNREKVTGFINDNPDCTSSDVIKFMIDNDI